ncbi:winged helix-turn-helix transcriptional regulator [Candidatus Woesearchaeota archaeon]|nr:winged helix-turn-helix transcriptional regulator [Candidatus Woesearchaeota archaeon]
METNKKILKILLKEFSVDHTITSLSKEAGLSRVGTWKILKRLEKENLIILSQIGTGKTSINRISLNWNNLVLEKTLALILTEEAVKNQRWINNFKDIGDKVGFLIVYGSIIHSSKEANDIDIIGITNKFLEVEKSIKNIQKTQIKKIHAINMTEKEFREELKENKAFIEAVKKGVILFGQEKFIKFMKGITIK